MTREKLLWAKRISQKNYIDEEGDDNGKIISDYVTNEGNARYALNNGQVVNVNNRGGQGIYNLRRNPSLALQTSDYESIALII